MRRYVGERIRKLREAQEMSLEQVVDWSRAICDVLYHMHTQHPAIVHRDCIFLGRRTRYNWNSPFLQGPSVCPTS